MIRLSRSLVRLLAATALLSIVPAGPALASSSKGAQVVSQSSCEEIDGGTWCRTEHAVYQEVRTPNGNQLLVTNLKLHIAGTYSDGQTYTSDWSLKNNVVVRRGETQEFHIRSIAVSVNEPDSLTCTYVVIVHWANGAAQFDSGIDTCVQTSP